MTALVLAGGLSSRMGSFKPLLPVGGRLVIDRVIDTLFQGGVTEIRVITGHRRQELTPLLEARGIPWVHNPDYAEGMYTSIKAGVASLSGSGEGDAFLLLPVDCVMVHPGSIRLVIARYESEGASIVYPCFRGRRGHPPLLSLRLRETLLNAQPQGGLQSLLRNYDYQAVEVETGDPGVIQDMDTPEDYRAVLLACNSLPDLAECQALLEKYHASERVCRHGETVSGLALSVGRELNSRGYQLSLPLLDAAARLHDLVRERPRHAGVARAILTQEGYPEVGEVVGRHMDINLPEGFSLDEAAVLYLSDKLVHEDRVVGLAERFAPALERARSDPNQLNAIWRRMYNASLIQQRVEEVLGIEPTGWLKVRKEA